MNEAPSLCLEGSASIAGTRVFSDVSLRVEAGRWTCLLGSSGVGKSTILKLFAGLDDHIELDGRVSASDGIALTGRVALMAQDDLLMPWLSALDNVLIGARLRGQKPDRVAAMECLAQVGLADRAGSRPRHLSGGQRQRVALARSLMESRSIVLLDEPFSALDALTRLQMQDLSAERLPSGTVLLVTHDPAEAVRLGHRILVMERGGLTRMAVPDSQPPRAPDDPDVLITQAELLMRLRGQANQ